MSELRRCTDCGHEVVLVHSGGVYRDILCAACNREMKYVSDVNTEWDGQSELYRDHKIIEDGEQNG